MDFNNPARPRQTSGAPAQFALVGFMKAHEIGAQPGLWPHLYVPLAGQVQILWGERGLVGRAYETMKVWGQYAENAVGRSMPSGHFIPEEAPEETVKALLDFFKP